MEIVTSDIDVVDSTIDEPLAFTDNNHLINTNHAVIWAKDFCRTVEKHNITIDEEFMIGWFANAFYAQEQKSSEGIFNLLDSTVQATILLMENHEVKEVSLNSGSNGVYSYWADKTTGNFVVNRGEEYRLAELIKETGIDSDIVNNVGFSSDTTSYVAFNLDQCMHKAFTIGSECLYGDYGYVPSTAEDLAKYYINEFGAQATQIKVFCGEMFLLDLSTGETSIIQTGKGEWKAETLEDAKLMALNFAKDLM